MNFSKNRLKIPAVVKTIAKLFISAAIIWLVVSKIDERLLLQVLQTAEPLWLLWAMAWFIVSKIIGALRFKKLLSTEDIQLSHLQNLHLYWLGMYYNLLLPGGISGDGYKIKVLMDAYASPFKKLLTLTLIDRFSGIIALFQICMLLVPWVPALEKYKYSAAIALVASFVFLWFGYKYAGNKKIVNIWKQVSLQSAVIQLAQTVAAMGLVLALHQQLHWPGYLFLFLVSSVVAMVPFTIGGAGARELTFLYGASFLQLQSEKAVAIAFLFYLISTMVAFYGITYSFKKIL